MNKTELIANIASKAELPKTDAAKALDAFTATVEAALVEGDVVQIIGFGTFGTHKRAARQGRNPQTGEMMEIPASVKPVFKAGKALKEAVNK